jgi:EpsI family protein
MTARLLVLVLVFGLAAGYVGYAMEPERVPLRQPFSSMATEAGRWRVSSTSQIEAKILAVLGVDDYVSRIYRASSTEFASLYVGYYQSQREGDTIHSPMNCLPGAGWIPLDTRIVEIPVAGRPAPIAVKRVVIQKGLDRQVVLYWYQSHGRVIGTEYWSKAAMVYDAFRLNRSDAALVRVVTPIREGAGSEGAADARAVEFVQAVFGQLEAHLPL